MALTVKAAGKVAAKGRTWVDETGRAVMWVGKGWTVDAAGGRVVGTLKPGESLYFAVASTPVERAEALEGLDEGVYMGLRKACEAEWGKVLAKCAKVEVPEERVNDAWRTVVDITLNGTYFCCREFGRRHLAAGLPGSIVNIGATYAWTGGPGFAHSAAAKAGVNSLTRAAALDYSDQNIRVNAIAPGTMWTGLVGASQQHAEPPADFPTLAGIPLGRWGLAKDIAYAALYLASDESAYVTGVTLPVDGGYCIGFSGMGAERPGLTTVNDDGS